MSGGAASGRKGSAYERELVNAVRDHGWGALRLGGSGSGTTGDRADILIGRPWRTNVGNPVDGVTDTIRKTDLWLVEAKSGKGNRLSVDGDEVEALVREAERWGATPLLGARSTERARPKAHYLVPPDECPRTDSDIYKLVFENATRTDDPLVADIAEAIVWPDDDEPRVEVVR